MYMCVGFFQILRADDLDVYPTRLTLTGIGSATVSKTNVEAIYQSRWPMNS